MLLPASQAQDAGRETDLQGLGDQRERAWRPGGRGPLPPAVLARQRCRLPAAKSPSCPRLGFAAATLLFLLRSRPTTCLHCSCSAGGAAACATARWQLNRQQEQQRCWRWPSAHRRAAILPAPGRCCGVCPCWISWALHARQRKHPQPTAPPGQLAAAPICAAAVGWWCNGADAAA